MAKSKPAPSSDAAPEAPPPSWLERAFQPRALLSWAILALVPVLAPWVVRQLPDLHGRPEYQLAFSQIRLEPLPSDGVPTNLASRVQLREQLSETVSLLDPMLPKTLAEAFARHPWIERVIEVRNQYPALVTVRVEYRRPVAMVLVKDGQYPVDGNGVLLPTADFASQDVERLIPVRGVVTTPYAAEGRPWTDPAVLAAADLARYLGPRWQELNLTAIRVAQPASADAKPEEIPLELETAGGSRILWGRTPHTQHPGELTGVQKLGRIEKYLAEFGAFERPTGPYEIDIRHWEEITRRPLAAAADTADKRTNRARR
jgi:hypothetical protein